MRFASWRQSRRFTEAARILLHIRVANASLTKLWNCDIIISTNKFQKTLDFPLFFGIMCVTTRKERENDIPEAILSSKTNLAQMQDILSPQSPKTVDEKYAYDIIQKAYWINEKKIEMLDWEKSKLLFNNYVNHFNAKGR